MKKATFLFSLLIIGSTATAVVGVSLAALGGGALKLGLGVCAIQTLAGDGCLDFGSDSNITGATPDEVANNIYGDGITRQVDREEAVIELKSFANQSFGVSMGEAKLEAIEARNNGEDKSTAYSAIQNEINDFYAQYQWSLLKDRNSEAIQLNKSFNEISNTNDLSRSDVFSLNNPDAPAEIHSSVDDAEVVEETFTLVNGSEKTSYNIVLRDAGCSYTDTGEQDRYLYTDMGDYIEGDCAPIGITATDSDGDKTEFVYNRDYSDAWNAIDQHRVRAIDNVEKVVDDYYNEYEAGELSTSDVLTPLEILQTSSTNYEDTGYYSYAALSLEYMGLSSNRTYAFKIQWNNEGQDEKEAWGQLFVNEADFNSTIEVNETYDASKGAAWFVYEKEEGSSETIELNGTFTPLEMRNTETGNSVNSTTVQSTDVVSPSVESMEEQLNELQEDLEDMQRSGPIGGAIGDLTGWLNQLFPSLPELNDSIVGLGLVALIGVLLLFA